MARKSYTDAQKNEIVKFALAQGRGGFSAAQKKYGVSFGALKAWTGGGKIPSKTKGKKSRIDSKPVGKVKGLKGVISALRKVLEKLESMS